MNPFDLTIPTKITKKINEWYLVDYRNYVDKLIDF